MALLIKRNIPGIAATAYANKTLEVKLSGGTQLIFYGVEESVHSELLASTEPLDYLKQLKNKYRFKDLGCLLG